MNISRNLHSRREWLSITACACAGTVTGGALRSETASKAKALLSPRMLKYISMQSSELIIEPLTSTLDAFTVCAPDLVHGSPECPEFALALSDTGLEFRSRYISARHLKTLLLKSSSWQYVGGAEHVYKTGESWSARNIVSFSGELAAKIKQHYGSSRVLREFAVVNDDVMAAVNEFARTGILERGSSPFFHAAFRHSDWSGDWTTCDELFLKGNPAPIARFGNYLTQCGAIQQSPRCFINVQCRNMLKAINL